MANGFVADALAGEKGDPWRLEIEADRGGHEHPARGAARRLDSTTGPARGQRQTDEGMDEQKRPPPTFNLADLKFKDFLSPEEAAALGYFTSAQAAAAMRVRKK